ncbi:glycoside hydrolase family 30 beta sandwich domain-containing protein [Paenibacillus thermoaerophilus]|uniref:Glycoside hydrolase family 30 beta sandwich domain-containing protein n=1 Tax=Paenibacillus thermoaerophilus TaxID=1215385 RepID=A0ABW2V2I0_9BACL|nr:glycoside hydrolase family 30 beta sandwich domain-containing protein [Paenibacillus thermoaerophilus]
MKRSGKMRKAAASAGFMVLLVAAAVWIGLIAFSEKAAHGPVSVWMTTADQSKLLHREADIGWNRDGQASDMTIDVDDGTEYQRMDGFGAAMTESSAWLIANKLSEGKRNELMNRLFSYDNGIGISYLRLPMGATDFSLSHYTYDDMPEGQTDPELRSFSIEHDKAYIIPALRQARAINPDLGIMASPWSAPAWMKTSGSLIKGSLKEEAYPVYAEYFVKFVQAYASEGIPIDAVTLQNEPHYEPDGYPGMRMEAREQAAFVKSHLGPAFDKAKLNTKIVVWDHNWDEPYYPIEVLSDPEANKYIAGSAFHGYAGEVANQQKVHDAFPDKDIYFTESSGGQWAPNFADNLKWDMRNLIIGAPRYWAKTVLKWNLALDESHGPANGGCSDCRGLVTIDGASGNVFFNSEYYAFGHASKFVKPGAYRIESSSYGDGGIENVAFRNPDGSNVLIAFNSASESRPLNVRWHGRSFAYSLPAGAAATFVWQGDRSANRVEGGQRS